jgi:HK97 family phage major capsid protein
MRITALKQSLAAVVESMDAMLELAANDDNRDLTAEETATFADLEAKAKGLEASIGREQKLIDLKSASAKPVTAGPGTLTVPAAPEVRLEPGTMFSRIALSLAATGCTDNRAAASWAQGVFGQQTADAVGNLQQASLGANMEQATSTKGGYLVDQIYSRDFVDVLRPRVVIRSMGARTIPMPEGNFNQRKKTAGSTASYIGERVPVPTTDVTVGQIAMSAKKLAALVPITNQLIRRATIGVEAMVRDDLTEAVALKEDQQFLRGAGSATAPTGLLNLVPAGQKITANATINLANVSNDLAKLELAVLEKDIPMTSPGYIMSYRTKKFLENLRDGNGNKAFPELAQNLLNGYRVAATTSVPNNLGGATDESEIYFGDFAQFMIGDTMSVVIASSSEAAYEDAGTMRSAFSNDETLIRIITEHDTQIRYDAAFAVLTGVKWKP